MTQHTSTGRPRGFDTDVALDQALEIFWRNGYRATTTRTLEDGLGLSQSSLYNAFGSKRTLFEAALDRYETMTADALIVPLETAGDGLASVERFFAHLTEWVSAEGRAGCLIINLMAEDGGEDGVVTARTRAYRRRVKGALRRALDRAAQQGEIAAVYQQERADVLFGQVLAINISARGGSPSREIEDLSGAVTHLLGSWRR